MSVAMRNRRTQVWLEGLGEWSWPGSGSAAAAVEVLPPAWVPACPPRSEHVTGLPRDQAPGAPWQSAPTLQRRLGAGALLSGLAGVCAVVALSGPLRLERLIGLRTRAPASKVVAVLPTAPPARPLPTLDAVTQDGSGSSIDSASYTSPALDGQGSFLVYLPPGYASTSERYPVLYLLPGNDQSPDAFLQIGLQDALDQLIATHTIAPLIAVMIQGGPGSNNWLNQGHKRYESYVVEVQELVDRMLPTISARAGRAIAGDSMGGFGAMNIALAYPYRFAVVESWLSFFNGLEGELHADRPVISRLGLHAFVYGGESDQIANPSEDAPFAAALRAQGADAQSAVYPGGHNMETLEAHVGHMLDYAGRALAPSAIPLRALSERPDAPSGQGAAQQAAAGDARAARVAPTGAQQ
jgi:enterochelin esterase-like enzyme